MQVTTPTCSSCDGPCIADDEAGGLPVCRGCSMFPTACKCTAIRRESPPREDVRGDPNGCIVTVHRPAEDYARSRRGQTDSTGSLDAMQTASTTEVDTADGRICRD